MIRKSTIEKAIGYLNEINDKAKEQGFDIKTLKEITKKYGINQNVFYTSLALKYFSRSPEDRRIISSNISKFSDADCINILKAGYIIKKQVPKEVLEEFLPDRLPVSKPFPSLYISSESTTESKLNSEPIDKPIGGRKEFSFLWGLIKYSSK